MEIIAITVSVNYDDILQHMIQQNSKFFHKWIIVTSSSDTNTIKLIEQCGKENIQLLFYNDFYKNRSKFNFGGARLFAQTYIDNHYSSANILFLDADIYLPDNFMEKLPSSLDNDTLYGSRRIDYWTLEDFNNETNAHLYTINDTVYFHGFFQLYKQNTKYLYNDSFNCSECDLMFNKKFNHKQKLDITVKHLGQEGKHWNGRKYNLGVF